MNDAWKGMAMKYIASYEALVILSNNDILDEEALYECKDKLLQHIMTDFRSEVED